MAQKWRRSGKRCWNRPYQKKKHNIQIVFGLDTSRIRSVLDQAVENLAHFAPQVASAGEAIQEAVTRFMNRNALIVNEMLPPDQRSHWRDNIVMLERGMIVVPDDLEDYQRQLLDQHNVRYVSVGYTVQVSHESNESNESAEEQRTRFLSLLDSLHNPYSPLVEPPFLCSGCLHYHGMSYNGTPFICAMHPYGPEKSGCMDKEIE